MRMYHGELLVRLGTSAYYCIVRRASGCHGGVSRSQVGGQQLQGV